MTRSALRLAMFSWALCVPSGWTQASWKELDSQAEELYRKGALTEALRAAQLALQAAATPLEKARSLDRAGFLHYSLGNRVEGEKLLVHAKEAQEVIGRDTSAYAGTLRNLAMLYRDIRRLDQALNLALESADILAKVNSQSGSDYAESLNVLGTVYYYRGEYEKAYSTFDRGLQIHEVSMDRNDPSEEYGTLCVQFAQVAQRMGRFPMASDLMRKAIESLRKRPGPTHPAYSATLAAAAFLELDLGNYVVAEQLNSEALQLLAAQLGESHPRVGIVLNNHAVIHQSLGNAEGAEAFYRRSLAIKRKTGEKVSLAVTIRNYGRLFSDRDPSQAEPLFREAVNLLQETPKPPAYELGNALLSLGQTQIDLLQYDQAAGTLRLALQTVEGAFGMSHPLYSEIVRQMGRLAGARGHAAEAESLYQRAISIVAEAKGRTHPQMAEHLFALGQLQFKLRRFAGAYAAFQETSEVQYLAQSQALAVGSESAKAAMAARTNELVPTLIAFQREAGSEIPEARKLAFEAVTNQKLRALDFIKGWREKLRAETHDSSRTLLGNWESLTKCQVALAVALGYRDWRRPPAGGCELQGTDVAGRYEKLAEELRTGWTAERGRRAMEAIRELRRRTDEVEATLSRQAPAFRQQTGRTSFEAIRSRLRRDELLLEFVRYQTTIPGSRELLYGAFLVGPNGLLHWVDLGPAKAIDQGVSDLLLAAKDWSASLSHGERRGSLAAERMASKILSELSEGAFAPIWPLLRERTGVRRLRIAADGMLLLFPFEALKFEGRRVIGRYAVSYVLAGREIADQERMQSRSPEPPLIAISPGPDGGTGSPARPFRAEDLDRLPGAQLEARQLRSLMNGASLLSQHQATEQALKRVRHPVVLHVIGHGVVRDSTDCLSEVDKPACGLNAADPYFRIMNLSAIVLEEAYGRGKGSAEDGILTAQELRSLDLHGTEMLVLSQCRMAAGLSTSGDGVYGMRRAASLAGARAFVAPLWRVSDNAQQQLMTRFYRELSAGTDRAEALRRAKLELLAKAGTKHFFFWAGTILSGKIDPLSPEYFSSTATRKTPDSGPR